MRKYSVDEIDRMRAALIKAHPVRIVRYQRANETRVHLTDETKADLHNRDMLVEQKLRTCMQAGIEPEELE